MCDTTRDSAEPSPGHAAAEHAFTLVELLVVVAILCLMAITIIISLSSIA
jgi:prepilin-type N-terminal cleavage/methylation domain-containing protein